jgi:ABC-type transport system involved in multi-copper enzyme maturation permease subunit
MTFLALLTKELRLRMRRERTMWVIIVYVLLMGLFGWFFISRFSNVNSYGPFGLNTTGLYLYVLLSQIQLFLILFITPAFTATAINGEKERQTFDLLLCSRLSAFSLIAGKLVAGLTNALLLVAASLPIFSLVFFFGGVSPLQVLAALLIYVATTVLVGSCGLFFSTILSRPAASTAVTYMTGMLWLIAPLVIYLILTASGTGQPSNQLPNLFLLNPAVALISTYPFGSSYIFSIAGLMISPWIAYSVFDLVAAAIFFTLSMRAAKPRPIKLPWLRNEKQARSKTTASA